MLAVGEEDRWSVAPVGPHGNPGPLRELPGATRRSLLAAPLADGLAWINVGEAAPADGLAWTNGGQGVLADDPMVLLGSWRADAVGGFLPALGDPAPAARQ